MYPNVRLGVKKATPRKSWTCPASEVNVGLGRPVRHRTSSSSPSLGRDLLVVSGGTLSLTHTRALDELASER